MRVLVVKTSSMGDVVHALPLVTDLAAALPGASIDWVVEEGFADIARLHPAVRRVIPVALRRWRRAMFRRRPGARSTRRAPACAAPTTRPSTARDCSRAPGSPTGPAARSTGSTATRRASRWRRACTAAASPWRATCTRSRATAPSAPPPSAMPSTVRRASACASPRREGEARRWPSVRSPCS